jgi:hypothetical protein
MVQPDQRGLKGKWDRRALSAPRVQPALTDKMVQPDQRGLKGKWDRRALSAPRVQQAPMVRPGQWALRAD